MSLNRRDEANKIKQRRAPKRIFYIGCYWTVERVFG